jgi:hypothetical protein
MWNVCAIGIEPNKKRISEHLGNFKETADQADLRLAFLTCRATVISRSYQLMEATRQQSDGGGCPNGPAARLGLPRTTAVAPIKSPGLSLFQASPTLARASRQLSGRDCFQALRKTVNRANQKTHVWAYHTNDADGYSGFGFTKIHRDESSAASNLQDRWRRMA